MNRTTTPQNMTASQIIDALMEVHAIKPSKRQVYDGEHRRKLPISINSRILACNPIHRSIVTEGLYSAISDCPESFDFFLALNSDAAAHATALVSYIKKPIIFLIDGVHYKYKMHSFNATPDNTVDLVLASCPRSVPYAMRFAEIMGKQFAYVSTDKESTDKKFITGTTPLGSRVMIVTWNETADEELELEKLVKIYHMHTEGIWSMKNDSHYCIMDHEEMKRKQAVLIENLIAIPDKIVDGIHYTRKKGLVVKYVFASFNFCLKYSKLLLAGDAPTCGKPSIQLEYSTVVHSLAKFSNLYDAMQKSEYPIPTDTLSEIHLFDQTCLKEAHVEV